MYCYKCGAEDPEYDVVGYSRLCGECREFGVMTVNEMVDLINDLEAKGLITHNELEDYIDEEYNNPELDFDDGDEMVLLAQQDAYNDMLRDGWED